MRIIRFIASSATLTFVLLVCVVFVNYFTGLFKDGSDVSSSSYTSKEIIIGISNEGIRALLLVYLFPNIKGAGSSYLHAIKFNLVIVGLIGSLWLICVYGMFELKQPNLFLIEDSVILLLQGITSGILLQWLYSKKII
jgi:hypothetical protein